MSVGRYDLVGMVLSCPKTIHAQSAPEHNKARIAGGRAYACKTECVNELLEYVVTSAAAATTARVVYA